MTLLKHAPKQNSLFWLKHIKKLLHITTTETTCMVILKPFDHNGQRARIRRFHSKQTCYWTSFTFLH